MNPADYRSANAVEQYFFRSPSGRFSCRVVAEPLSAGCHGDTSPVPDRPATCSPEISWGAGMWVDAGGGTGFLCTGGTIYSDSTPGPVLGYGDQLSVLGLTCVAREDGVRCAHDATGHGFRIAAESNELF